MKTNVIFKSILILSLLYTVYTGYKYSEDFNSVLSRLNWSKDHTQLITKGKVEFEYTNEKGTHCLAKDNLRIKEFVFRVPNDYLICACKII